MKMDDRDVVVVGGGPAGIAAAVQLRRGGLEPLLIERDAPGGLVRNAGLVENYPGFPDGIGGPELADLFARQLERAGVEVSIAGVERIEYEDGLFILHMNGETARARVVVLATGTVPRRLEDVEISGAAAGRIYYEVHPLRGIDRKRIAIVGAGDAAFDYALTLAPRNEVTILGRSRKPKCIPVLGERCEKERGITVRMGTAVESVRENSGGLDLICSSAGGERLELGADCVIVAIGRDPNLGLLGASVREHFDDLVGAETLCLIGDVRNGSYRQTAIGVGDGVRAAMEICGSRPDPA